MNETSNGAGEQLPLLDFAQAESSRAEPQRLREVVRILLRKPDVWQLVAPHFRDGGLAGSLQFDKAVAAYKVREWDDSHEHLLGTVSALTELQLAGAITKELRRVYELNGGRIIRALPPPEAKAPPQ